MTTDNLTPIFDAAHQALLEENITKFDNLYRQYLWVLKKYRSDIQSPAMTAEKVYEKILLRRQRGIKPIPTGVDWWDEFAGPLRRGNTYVVAGYAGSGKTTLSLNLAWSMAKVGRKVWYYCLELAADEVFEVLAGHIRGKAVINEQDETLAYSQIQGTGFRFYEPSGWMPWDKRLEEICDTVRKENVEVVFVDNLGFLVRANKNSYEVEQLASARIKGLAQELDIPVILIHHLRKPENDQTEPEPNAHTMKGSGAIMADASDSFILHHPLDETGNRSRHEVGYLLSGKPRWGMGGKRYVRLNGSARTYHPATVSEYQRKTNGRKREREY